MNNTVQNWHFNLRLVRKHQQGHRKALYIFKFETVKSWFIPIDLSKAIWTVYVDNRGHMFLYSCWLKTLHLFYFWIQDPKIGGFPSMDFIRNIPKFEGRLNV